MAFTDSEALCREMIVGVVNAFGQNASITKQQRTGLLNVITNPQFTNGTMQEIVDAGDGKRDRNDAFGHAVRVTYSQPLNAADVLVAEPATCASTTDKDYFSQLYSADAYIQTPMYGLDRWDIDQLCQSPAQWAQDHIIGAWNGLNRRLNLLLATLLVAEIGEFEDGSTSKAFNILNADGSSHFFGESEMLEQLDNSGAMSPWIVGGGNWPIYVRNKTLGSGNDGGTRIDQTVAFNFEKDNQLAPLAVLNDPNGAFALDTNAVQMFHWNHNRADNEVLDDPRKIRTTITDPRTGLAWDLNIVEQDCGAGGTANRDKWTMWMNLYYGLATRPTNAYEAGHELEDVNGVFKIIGNQLP